MKNSDRRIVYAGTTDRPFFKELWSDFSRRRVQELGFNVEIPTFTTDATKEEWLKFLAGAEGIVTTWNSPCIDQSVLDVAPNLKIMGHAAGSLAGYVSPELFASGDKVCGANDDMAFSVAEWCLMGALMGRRSVTNYTGFGAASLPIFPDRAKGCRTIRNAVVGIWGFGAVAAHLVKLLQPLMPAKILVNSRHMGAEEAAQRGVELADFDTVISESEIVFTLAGLSEHTVGRFNAEKLKLVRDGAVLVNGGRGDLFDEAALIAELQTGRISAVLDVFHTEPLPPESPLNRMPNVILTPHNAGYPSRFRYIATVLEEFDRCFRGEPLFFEVNASQIEFMTVNLRKLAK